MRMRKVWIKVIATVPVMLATNSVVTIGAVTFTYATTVALMTFTAFVTLETAVMGMVVFYACRRLSASHFTYSIIANINVEIVSLIPIRRVIIIRCQFTGLLSNRI